VQYALPTMPKQLGEDILDLALRVFSQEELVALPSFLEMERAGAKQRRPGVVLC
jgi:hypothetical protein